MAMAVCTLSATAHNTMNFRVPTEKEITGTAAGRWKAVWIEASKQSPSMMFRKEFTVTGRIKAARILATSQGLYELRLNGKKVGNELFTPGWTSYNNRLQYQAYDITPMLHKGRNAVGIMLGNGWFRSRMSRVRRKWAYGDRLRALVQIELTYKNGRRDTIGTDSSWLTAPSPVTMTDIYDGETYDARLEKEGWDSAGYDDNQWQKAAIAQSDMTRLIPQEGVAVRVVKHIKPVRLLTTPRGETVLDFGQNLTGWVKFTLRGHKGDTITIRHAETLDKEGNFYTVNLRTAKATDRYIFGKNGIVSHRPKFTFYGFRYAKIEGVKGNINREDFTAEVVSSDLRYTGTFECSDTLVNRLVESTRWSMVDNFLDVPTDCPQRDERLGWTADAQVFAPAACRFADVKQFFVKWMRDLVAEQSSDGGVPCVVPDLRRSYGSSGWDDAVAVIPHVLYKVYGDTAVLREFYPAMKKWVGYVRKRTGRNMLYGGGRFGDWFAYTSQQGDYPGATTDKDLVGTAYFARSVQLTAQAARILGKKSELKYYENLHDSICQAFCREYVTPNGRLASNTQTAYTLALAFDLLPTTLRQQAAQRLADDVNKHGHITTGFLGTPLICQVLTQFGHADEAYKLLFNKRYPSWLYPMTKGATTIWEKWDAILPDGTVGKHSLNHYAFGAVVDWLFGSVAGISQEDTSTAYDHIVLRPALTRRLSYAKASLESPHGSIRSHWRMDGTQLTWTVSIPQGSTAKAFLPHADSSTVTVNGKTVLPTNTGNGDKMIELKSGEYTIKATIDADGSGR